MVLNVSPNPWSHDVNEQVSIGGTEFRGNVSKVTWPEHAAVGVRVRAWATDAALAWNSLPMQVQLWGFSYFVHPHRCRLSFPLAPAAARTTACWISTEHTGSMKSLQEQSVLPFTSFIFYFNIQNPCVFSSSVQFFSHERTHSLVSDLSWSEQTSLSVRKWIDSVRMTQNWLAPESG